MRKVMSREVTKTTVKLAKMESQNGLPVATQMEDEILLGNVGIEKAQRQMNKKFNEPVTVFEVIPSTLTYEMPVEDFIKHATVKTDIEAVAETQEVE